VGKGIQGLMAWASIGKNCCSLFVRSGRPVMCIVYVIEADQERLRNFEIGPGARFFFQP